MSDQSIRRYFYITLFLGGMILTALVFWPFVKVLVLSIALSAILFPLYKFILKKIKVSWVASLLTVIIFVIVLIIPIFIIGTLVFKQSQHLYGWAVNQGGLDNITSSLNHIASDLFPEGSINLKDGITAIAGKLTAGVGLAFTATATTIFSFLLVVLSLFYFLRDGEQWKKTLLSLSPLSHESGHKILQRLNIAVNGIVKGYLLIALVQGFLMSAGLFIFGVPHAALWGVLAGIASMIPSIGTALVAVPAILFLFITGHTGAAVGMIVWSTALVGSIDNFLNPLIVGNKIEIHPLLVLFSVLGGIALMGPIGILIGPLIISFMFALVSVYKSEIKNQ